jgi:hypothetical protein
LPRIGGRPSTKVSANELAGARSVEGAGLGLGSGIVSSSGSGSRSELGALVGRVRSVAGSDCSSGSGCDCGTTQGSGLGLGAEAELGSWDRDRRLGSAGLPPPPEGRRMAARLSASRWRLWTNASLRRCSSSTVGRATPSAESPCVAPSQSRLLPGELPVLPSVSAGPASLPVLPAAVLPAAEP